MTGPGNDASADGGTDANAAPGPVKLDPERPTHRRLMHLLELNCPKVAEIEEKLFLEDLVRRKLKPL